jgi:hypothetical protein
MKSLNWILPLLVAAALPLTSASADDLLGKQLRGSGEAPLGNAGGGQIDATVGAGVEYSGLWCCNQIDVSATQITVDFLFSNGFGASSQFNGWVFRDVTDNIPNFFNVTLDPSSTITPKNLFFSDNGIFVDMAGKGFTGNDFIVLNVIIPEPSSLALGVLAFAATISFARRRRRVVIF